MVKMLSIFKHLNSGHMVKLTSTKPRPKSSPPGKRATTSKLVSAAPWVSSRMLFQRSRNHLCSLLHLNSQGIHRAYPGAYIFSSCPPDPTVRCVSPAFYAVVGASAMLGGVTRMTSACLWFLHPPTRFLIICFLSSLSRRNRL